MWFDTENWPATISRSRAATGRESMRRTWKKPKIVEIAVGMEINCYACAELD